MDLLLTHGYFLEDDAKERAIMKPYPPLGILYLSSHLRSKGFDVEIYDSTFGSRRELIGILEKGPPSVLGIGANLMTRGAVLEIVAAAQRAGWTVIVGGPEPANYAREYLDAGARVVVEGEAEITLEELLPALGTGDLGRVNGICFRRADGAVIRTGARALVQDLDAQPWPDRERISIERYLDVWRRHHGKGSVSVITARGCPYHCRWCSHSTFGKTHRRRSVTSVVDEVEWILGRYGPEMLWMADDVFTIQHAWVLEYAAEMKRRGIAIPFECITRADRLSARVAGALAELGCFRVWIGSESGSQRVLDAMQRGVKVEQVREAVVLCRAHGIQVGMFLMWGYEGEQPADIEATVEHVKACLPDVFLTTVSYPIKGTPYYDEVASRLVGIGDWARSTDRDFKIAGRHSRRYYSFADQLLKSEVALARSGDGELHAQIKAARQGLAEAFQEVEA